MSQSQKKGGSKTSGIVGAVTGAFAGNAKGGSKAKAISQSSRAGLQVSRPSSLWIRSGRGGTGQGLSSSTSGCHPAGGRRVGSRMDVARELAGPGKRHDWLDLGGSIITSPPLSSLDSPAELVVIEQSTIPTRDRRPGWSVRGSTARTLS